MRVYYSISCPDMAYVKHGNVLTILPMYQTLCSLLVRLELLLHMCNSRYQDFYGRVYTLNVRCYFASQYMLGCSCAMRMDHDIHLKVIHAYARAY